MLSFDATKIKELQVRGLKPKFHVKYCSKAGQRQTSSFILEILSQVHG